VIISSGSDGARVKIIDFGLAQLSTATRLTQASSPIGTDSYVSPEQMNGASGRSSVRPLVTWRNPLRNGDRETTVSRRTGERLSFMPSPT
jgi:serine/threonine protein kinase